MGPPVPGPGSLPGFLLALLLLFLLARVRVTVTPPHGHLFSPGSEIIKIVFTVSAAGALGLGLQDGSDGNVVLNHRFCS